MIFRSGGVEVPALNEASLAIEHGSSTSVVGRSGSGKSTLISVLSLLRRPTSGRLLVDGTDVASLNDAELSTLRSRTVGTVFQSFHLDPALSSQENVLLPWYFGSRGPRRTARTRALDLLELLGIPELAGRRPTEMSGGQRQRVAIARALFAEPALLMADEPTGNLDEDTAGVIADVLFSLPATLGTAVVVVTHDAEIAARARSRVRLAHGVLESHGCAAVTGQGAPGR
ncbi:MAG: ABC transporter ATP-binding protein [Tetrasphaera sp.]